VFKVANDLNRLISFNDLYSLGSDSPIPHEKARVFCADSLFFVRQNYKLFAVEPNKKAIIFLLKN